jgi:hypothetical protein
MLNEIAVPWESKNRNEARCTLEAKQLGPLTDDAEKKTR